MQLFEIGTRIKQLRIEAQLTQQDLAASANISRVTLGKLERGETVSVSLKTLDLILAKLNYEIEFQPKTNFGLPSLDQLAQEQ